MKRIIKRGDYVRHKNPAINGGWPICVQELNGDETEVMCVHFDSDLSEKKDWFSISDFILDKI